MTKEEIKNMENSELLAHLFFARDELIHTREAMNESANTEGIIELFDKERERYDELLKEVFRRMKK